MRREEERRKVCLFALPLSLSLIRRASETTDKDVTFSRKGKEGEGMSRPCFIQCEKAKVV